jgi:1-acyl-sn-glycerol-3-phosphate acyltransferase
MQNIIIDQPYRFVPPRKGVYWPRALQTLVPMFLRRKFGIESIEFRGIGHLQSSLASGYGITLTPNHCRPCDPLVMAMLSRKVGRPFYYMASWHLFMQGKLQAWLVNRLGAFSVYREGIDREALRAATDILVEGKRPLVLFPEGVISRTNDLLRPFMEGISLITGAASKQRAKLSLPASVVIHPVAIKYLLITEVESSLHQVLDEIEARFCWQRRETPLVERLVRVGEALLGLKELEYLGRVQAGAIEQRLQALIDHLLDRLETKWLGGKRQSTFMGRIKALRAAILKDMLAGGQLPPQKHAERWRELADIYLTVQLSNYPSYYVRSNPTPERLTETVERFEEDTTDKARIHGRWRVLVQIGEAVKLGANGGGSQDSLSQQLQETIQRMLDAINGGREPAA